MDNYFDRVCMLEEDLRLDYFHRTIGLCTCVDFIQFTYLKLVSWFKRGLHNVCVHCIVAV